MSSLPDAITAISEFIDEVWFASTCLDFIDDWFAPTCSRCGRFITCIYQPDDGLPFDMGLCPVCRYDAMARAGNERQFPSESYIRMNRIRSDLGINPPGPSLRVRYDLRLHNDPNVTLIGYRAKNSERKKPGPNDPFLCRYYLVGSGEVLPGTGEQWTSISPVPAFEPPRLPTDELDGRCVWVLVGADVCYPQLFINPGITIRYSVDGSGNGKYVKAIPGWQNLSGSALRAGERLLALGLLSKADGRPPGPTISEQQLLRECTNFSREYHHYPKRDELAERLNCDPDTITNTVKALGHRNFRAFIDSLPNPRRESLTLTRRARGTR